MDKPEKANLLLEGVENKLTPVLKVIVLMDSYGNDLVERGKKCGVEITSMKAMEVSPALPRSGGIPGPSGRRCGTQWTVPAQPWLAASAMNHTE